MTNWDKVKEMMDVEEITTYSNLLCKTIQKMRNAEMCEAGCERCKEWLKQEYKEPILTDKEREYLSAVIKPFRDTISSIERLHLSTDEDYIIIFTNEKAPQDITLPPFLSGTMYTRMTAYKEYTLEELDL